MTDKPASKQAPAVKKPPPPPQVQAACERSLARMKARAGAPDIRIEIGEDGAVMRAHFGEPEIIGNLRTADTFATSDWKFSGSLLLDLCNAAYSGGEFKQPLFDKLLAMVHAIAPQNEGEAMLAVQMAVIHKATMDTAYALNHSADELRPQEGALLNKLSRTFCVQTETLKKGRAPAEQLIRIVRQDIHVTDGGQAVIAGGSLAPVGGAEKSGDQPHEPAVIRPDAALALGTALPSHIEADRPSVSGPIDQGAEGMPLPRRGRRRATGDA